MKRITEKLFDHIPSVGELFERGVMMVPYAEKAIDHLLPSAEELWDRGGATMKPYEKIDGSIEDRPFFDLEISNKDTYRKPISDEPFITKRGRNIGRKVLHQIDINGVNHLARGYIPHGDATLTITSGAAWMVTIDGYPEDRSDKLFADNGEPVLQASAPYTTQGYPGLEDFLKVPSTVRESHITSLARAAQIEQLIFKTMSEDLYDLPMNQYPIGDSRDAATTSGQYLYAPMYGANIVGFDTKARPGAHKIEVKHIPGLGVWTVTTVIGAVAVSFSLTMEGQLGILPGTTSLDPNFWAASITGTRRSLTTGESGRMIGWVPQYAYGIDVLYGNDSVSRGVDEQWSDHPNVYRKIVPGGTHSAIIHPLAHKGRRTRTGRFIHEYKEKNQNVDLIDYNHVYGVAPTIWTPHTSQHEAA